MTEEQAERSHTGLTAPLSRRGLAGLVAAAWVALGLAAASDAKKKKKKKKKKKPTPPAVCTPQTQAVTCAGGKCGNVTGNCGQQVDCGACNGYMLDQKIGSQGSGEGQFRSPTGIAIDSDGNLYVADTGNNRIHKLSNDGEYLDDWGGVALALGGPQGVAVDSGGNVYVAVTGQSRVVKLNSSGGFVTEWETGADEFDFFFSPKGIAVDPEGQVWLSDYGNHRMLKFSNSGEFLEEIDGKINGMFHLPGAIVHDGALYVADTGRDRVQRVPGGPLGEEGTGDGDFLDPRGVAVDGDGNLYVADTGNNRIQKFDSDGEFVLAIGESQAADGNFGNLAGIAVDNAGNIFVVDEERSCLHKFRPAGATRAASAKSRDAVEERGSSARRKKRRRR